MTTAKWATPSAESSNLAGTALDSLASGSGAAVTAYDNSTNLDLYLGVRIALGSITPAVGGYITLQVFTIQGGVTPDFVAGAGDSYSQPVLTATGVKNICFPMVRAYPRSMRFVITNNTGVALAATGNSVVASPYNESAA
jgi:hypothetical protein